MLFRQTVLENITFGKPEAEIEEVIAAARKVGADEFIQALPDGYDTLIGEGGQTLSGGQRQRIAFARAALRNIVQPVRKLETTELLAHQATERRCLVAPELEGLRRAPRLAIVSASGRPA